MSFPKTPSEFTDTESYIIELIRQGKANKEIADEIHVSEDAIKNRIHRLLRKFDCKNRVQLALLGST